jgi:glycosyltransferase involved in cell wall biosynthesis
MSPKVSVVVPTLNAVTSIRDCLDSVRRQTFEGLEIIVVDACSSDETAPIAQEFGRVIVADVGSTHGRLIGAEAATGDYVLCLDADQVLREDAVENALATRHDVVAFGELGMGHGLVALINRLDKATVNRSWEENVDPLSGFIRPRLYRRDLLLDALRRIPSEILEVRPSPFSDDSLIFLLTKVPAREIGFVPNAIYHREMEGLRDYLRKWTVYGQSAKIYLGTPYEFIVRSRGRRRVGPLGLIAVAPGLALRAIPFWIGLHD